MSNGLILLYSAPLDFLSGALKFRADSHLEQDKDFSLYVLHIDMILCHFTGIRAIAKKDCYVSLKVIDSISDVGDHVDRRIGDLLVPSTYQSEHLPCILKVQQRCSLAFRRSQEFFNHPVAAAHV